MESGSLSRGLYNLNSYVECVEDVTCAVSDLQAVSDVKSWHACFGHLNFASLTACRNLRWFLCFKDLSHHLSMYVKTAFCYDITVVMCVNTLRTVRALFPSLGGFFPRALYIHPSL